MTDPTPRGTPPPPVPPPGAPSVPPPGGAPGAPESAPSGPRDRGTAPPQAPSAPDATSAPGTPRQPLDDRERTLDRRIVTMWRIGGALAWIVPLGGLTIAGFVTMGRWGWLVAIVCLALYGLRVVWLPAARYARWRWRLASLALELRYGVLVRQYEAVPYFRIQQIDITQGPIDRLLGLATLVVTTASASGSATLPGIAAADAPDVRAELLERATRAVADHPGDLQDAV